LRCEPTVSIIPPTSIRRGLVDGLRLVLASTVGERYRVRVSEDGATVGLW
jgi:hypothetical protein